MAIRLRSVPGLNKHPPAITGFAGGRPKVEEIMAYFPALIPKSLIQTKVEIVEA